MLRPVKSGGFDSPDRTGLLWALEVIAWNEAHLFRVARVLARLCEVPINDNWVNKPENSMESLVRSWLPQTAANIDQRLALLDMIVRSEEHTSELQSLMRISYAVFCLKKKKKQ